MNRGCRVCKKPNPGGLSRESVEFGYTGKMGRSNHEARTSASDEVYAFTANYVGKSYGMAFINKWLKANKGKYLLNLITVCDLVDVITIIKNHKPVCELYCFKGTLKEDEQNRCNDYKELDRPEERKKYSPKIPRFSAGIRVEGIVGSVT